MAHADDDRVNDMPVTNGYKPDGLFLDLFAALASEFAASEVKTRSQAGRTFSYVTARAVMNRLDDVVGPANWWDRYVLGEKSVLCELTIRLPDGTTLTKVDAGGYTSNSDRGGDEGDDEKAGLSDALKRTAVKFGVGRYLYRDGVPAFIHARGYEFEDVRPEQVRETPQPQRGSWGGGGSYGGGDRDSEYRQSRPASEARPASGAPRGGNGGGGGQAQGGGFSGVPKSGKGLFAWTKDMEQKHDVGLLKWLNSWGKLQEFPARMVDWDQDQVAAAYGEAVRKLQSLGAGAGAEPEPGDDDDRPY